MPTLQQQNLAELHAHLQEQSDRLLAAAVQYLNQLHGCNNRQAETIRELREETARLRRSQQDAYKQGFNAARDDHVNPMPKFLRTEFVPKQHPQGSPEIVRDACDAIVKAGDSLHATKTRKTVVCNVTDGGSPFPPGTIFENGPEWHGIPIDEPATMDGSWSPAELDENKPKVVSEADRLREQLDIFRDELRRIEQHLKAVGIELKFRDDGSFVGVRATNVLFGRDG